MGLSGKCFLWRMDKKQNFKCVLLKFHKVGKKPK